MRFTETLVQLGVCLTVLTSTVLSIVPRNYTVHEKRVDVKRSHFVYG
jgi:dUTPase